MVRQPFDDGRAYIYAGFRGQLVALHRDSGRPAWRQTVGDAGTVLVAASLEHVVAVTKHDGKVLCVEALSGNVLWRTAGPCPTDSIVLEGGYVMIAGAGTVRCHGIDDGRQVWSAPLGAGEVVLALAKPYAGA